MKRLIYILVGAIAMTFTLNSCDLPETNIDPTRLNDVSLNLILPTAISQTAYNQSALQARMPGIVMQQFVGFDAQQVGYSNYNITSNEFNNYWNFGLYAGALKDCDVIINKAVEEGQIHYEAIAKILMAYNYGMATTMFGDIPFSQALKGLEELEPTYDSQEDVYAGIQQLLDEAIVNLGQESPAAGPGGDDLIFSGDADLWAATAHALKARFYMHVSKQDNSAYAKVLTEIDMAFTSLDEQPNFKWDLALAAACPIAAFGVERSNTLNIDKSFAASMDANADPRKSLYMIASNDTVADPDWLFHSITKGDNLYWAQNNTVVPFISFVEIEFMRAEALLASGGSDVESALVSGIVASMQQVGLAAADYDAYVADRSDLSGMNDAEKLERIMEEAYTSYYGFSMLEVWTNYRRTGYPVLTPSPNGTSGLNPSGVVPRRFPYPLDEETTNGDNVSAAVTNQGGGLLDVDTWAHK